MQRTYISRAFFVLSLLLVPASALSSMDFYRVQGPYNSEPRPDRNWLSTVKFNIVGGWGNKGKNGTKNKVDGLNIYGLHDMHSLAEGVPNLVPADNVKLINLRDATVGANAEFGKLLFAGKFNHVSFDFTLLQNFKHGFFGEVVIPVRRLEVKSITHTDQLVNEDGLGVGAKTAWDIFLADITDILAVHNVSIADTKQTGLGDVEINAGWTYNNQSSKLFDFLDTTIKVGVSVPSGKAKDENKAFSLPAGYDKHTGIPVSFDIAIGMYEWMTCGAHVGGTFFVNKTKEMRMQTHTSQNGFVKLGLGKAERDLGNLFDVGGFLKADHIAGGFSFMVGYNYASQKATTLVAENLTDFPTATINDDEMLKSWNAHTLNFGAEYDFSKEGNCVNPTVAVFYNRPVGGKRILLTNNVGGSACAHLVWKF